LPFFSSFKQYFLTFHGGCFGPFNPLSSAVWGVLHNP
jgi:hypothetical protein